MVGKLRLFKRTIYGIHTTIPFLMYRFLFGHPFIGLFICIILLRMFSCSCRYGLFVSTFGWISFGQGSDAWYETITVMPILKNNRQMLTMKNCWKQLWSFISPNLMGAFISCYPCMFHISAGSMANVDTGSQLIDITTLGKLLNQKVVRNLGLFW